MLATLIQRYDNKSSHFKNERQLKFYRLSGATFYDCINTIFIKLFLDNKMSVFEEFEPLIMHKSAVLLYTVFALNICPFY